MAGTFPRLWSTAQTDVSSYAATVLTCSREVNDGSLPISTMDGYESCRMLPSAVLQTYTRSPLRMASCVNLHAVLDCAHRLLPIHTDMEQPHLEERGASSSTCPEVALM